MYDFNLCGKYAFPNYLFSETYSGGDRQVIENIFLTLKIVSKYYVFSENETQTALPLYRCIKPLWFTKVQELKEAGNNIELIKKCLDEIEYMQTENIDFISYMI